MALLTPLLHLSYSILNSYLSLEEITYFYNPL